MSNLRKVKSGDPLTIPAETFKTFIDAALDFRKRQTAVTRKAQAGTRQSGIILVRNDSGADRDRFHVLGLGAPLIPPADNEAEFQNRVALTGETPALDTHEGRFCVLLEPLPAGAVGTAMAVGVCVARVRMNDPDHRFADVADGDCACLDSAASGSARILWKNCSGDGCGDTPVWAVVSLGGGAAAEDELFLFTDCDGVEDSFFAAGPLAEVVDKVVRHEGICWAVTKPLPADIPDCAFASVCFTEDEIAELPVYEDCSFCDVCWLLQDCDELAPDIVTNTDLYALRDRVVLIGGSCYRVSLSDTCVGAMPVTIETDYSVCEVCNTCWQLTPCDGNGPTRISDSDLADYDGMAVYVDGTCYAVSPADTCAGAETILVDPERAYPNGCDECVDCWVLTPCPNESASAIVTDTDLMDHRDKVVLVGGVCYSVSPATDCTDPVAVEVLESYSWCADCKRCYELRNCWDSSDSRVVSTDLRDLGGFSTRDAVPGSVWKLGEDCYTVTSTEADCASATTPAAIEHVSGCDVCFCWKLEPCPDTTGGVIYASQDSIAPSLDGQTVRLAHDNQCYVVTREASVGCADTSDVSVLASYAGCGNCRFFKLTDCDGAATPVITHDNLLSLVGRVVKWGDVCWLVSEADCGVDDCTSAVGVGGLSAYDDCVHCQGNRIYVLTPCPPVLSPCGTMSGGTGDPFYTDTDLSGVVGSIIKIGSACLAVSVYDGDPVPVAPIGEYTVYGSCERCLLDQEFDQVILTGVSIDGASLRFTRKRLLLEDGKLYVCDESDLVIAGTTCP